MNQALPNKAPQTNFEVGDLCHASEDKARVKKLYDQLKHAGYRPWLDKIDLLPGQKRRPAIKKIITNHDNLVLVCLSNNSVTKRGVVQQVIKWALDILEQMPEETIYLIPVRLEECSAPDQLADLHWVDIFEPDGFEYLTRALDYEIGQRQAAPEPPPQPVITEKPPSPDVKVTKPKSVKPSEPSPPKHPKIIKTSAVDNQATALIDLNEWGVRPELPAWILPYLNDN